MEKTSVNIGNILASDWIKSQGVNPYAINNPQTLDLKPKTDTISVSVDIEKYDNLVAEIIGDEIVVKLGKVKIGGVK